MYSNVETFRVSGHIDNLLEKYQDIIWIFKNNLLYFLPFWGFLVLLAFLQSWCLGFSLRQLLLLWSEGSRTNRFQPLGSSAQTQQLRRSGLIASQRVGSSQTRDRTCVSCIAGATEPPRKHLDFNFCFLPFTFSEMETESAC